jgi:uncharacterized membrane protein YczE
MGADALLYDIAFFIIGVVLIGAGVLIGRTQPQTA